MALSSSGTRRAVRTVWFASREVIRGALVPAGPEVMFYCTIGGAMGILVPFQTREDIAEDCNQPMIKTFDEEVRRVKEDGSPLYSFKPPITLLQGSIDIKRIILPMTANVMAIAITPR